ncbi:hypothetical protein I3V78_33990 [Archangium primigenium]|nr:hypothetical protein [Archangium primigenium]
MVLALAAVVIGGVLTLYLSTSNQRKNTESIAAALSGVQRLLALLAGTKADPHAFTADNIVIHRARILPEEYWRPDDASVPNGAGKYVLPNGAGVTVYPATESGPPGGLIWSMTFKDAKSCMAVGKENLFADSLLVQDAQTGGRTQTIRSRDASGKIAFDMRALVQACADPATGVRNIRWIFVP